MYEVLEDGRVALDPNDPTDRIALSIYGDLLNIDLAQQDEPDPLVQLYRDTAKPGIYHLSPMKDLDKMVGFLKEHDYELVKLVIKDEKS